MSSKAWFRSSSASSFCCTRARSGRVSFRLQKSGNRRFRRDSPHTGTTTSNEITLGKACRQLVVSLCGSLPPLDALSTTYDHPQPEYSSMRSRQQPAEQTSYGLNSKHLLSASQQASPVAHREARTQFPPHCACNPSVNDEGCK